MGKSYSYPKVIFMWCPLVTVLFIFGFGGLDNLGFRFCISMIIVVTVASCCYWGSKVVSLVFESFQRRRGLKSKNRGVFWGVLISFPFLLPGLYFGFSLAGNFSKTIGHPWTPPNFSSYSAGVIFGIMVSGLFTLFEVIRESKEAKRVSELKFQSLENEKLKAQISALTAQLNPHLLFNSLNTIASAIVTDPKSAEEMVVQLSELYRGILKSAKGDMHSLESELLLCRSYLEIEQKRFGSRIQYQIQIDDQLDPKQIQIPVLLLQPLVENAVKHGLQPKREGGTVSIGIKRIGTEFIIDVTDNGIGINYEKPSAGTGTGVTNCQSRLKMKYGDDSKFRFFRNENSETVVSIRLPMGEVCL